jgi:hypothetical protein
MQFESARAKVFWFFLLLFLPSYADGVLADTPENIVRHAMIEHLLDGDEKLLQKEISVPVEHIQATARGYIGENLADSAISISGKEFRFLKPGNAEKNLFHVGVWVFSYANEKKASVQNEKIRTEYFGRSKIMIPFFHFLEKNKVVIIFTESAEEKMVFDFVKSMPQKATNGPLRF